MGPKIYILNHYTTGVILFGERVQVSRQGLAKVILLATLYSVMMYVCVSLEITCISYEMEVTIDDAVKWCHHYTPNMESSSAEHRTTKV